MHSSSFLLLLIAATASAQVEPHAGLWKTWVLSSGSQMRLPPPPDSVTAGSDLQAVRSAMAGADASARSARLTGTLLSKMGSGNSLTSAAVYAYAAGYRLRECPRGRALREA